jgi:hypothetical protein
LFFAENYLVVEHVEFEGGDAAETPAGEGEGVDQVLFDGAGGLIEGQVVFEECLEVFLGFAGEDGEGRGEAVFQGVLGGAGFALGRGGSFGFCAVGAGGVGFGLRWHA